MKILSGKFNYSENLPTFQLDGLGVVVLRACICMADLTHYIIASDRYIAILSYTYAPVIIISITG